MCISYYAPKLIRYYSVSGDTGVQAIIGRAWEDTPLQIYCSFEVAAFVRSWIFGQDVHQILTGFSANLTNLGKVSHQPLYYSHSDANVVVSHVEYYKNRDDTVWYQSVNGRDRTLDDFISYLSMNRREIPSYTKRQFRLNTSDGIRIPFKSYPPEDANINLIVMMVRYACILPL